MSSSDPDSKIDFLDPPDAVQRKIKKAFCEEGNVADNGVLAFVEAVLIPISELRLERAASKASSSSSSSGPDPGPDGEAFGGDEQKPFVSEGATPGALFSVHRDEKYGGPMHFSTYDALKEAFEKRDVHPRDLKGAVADALVSLLAPIRKRFEESKEWQEVTQLAYPSPVPEKKKKKVRVSILSPIGRSSLTERIRCRRKCIILLHRERVGTQNQPQRMERQVPALHRVKQTAYRLPAQWRQIHRVGTEKVIDQQSSTDCTKVSTWFTKHTFHRLGVISELNVQRSHFVTIGGKYIARA